MSARVLLQWRWVLGFALMLAAPLALALDAGQALLQARSNAQAALQGMTATQQSQRKVCAWLSTNTGATGYAYGAVVANATTCPTVGIPGQVGTYTLSTVAFSGSCAARSSYTGTGPWASYVGQARSGSVACRDGCDGAWFSNADDTMTWNPTGGTCPADEKAACAQMASSGYYWNAVLKVCEPPIQECPTGKISDGKGGCKDDACPAGLVVGQDGTCYPEKNECPAGEIKAPSGECLPGEGQCAQGEAKGADGTCKKDSDGDGEPDEDDPNEKSFSGGDNCDSPPSCSGDPIMCGQARIQWRIDCNTRRNVNIQGGTCDSPPICVGKDCKAMEYAQLLMQWRTACAIEKGKAGGGGSSADPNVAAIKDALTGNAGSPDIGEEGDPSGAFSDESGYGEAGPPGEMELDTSGFGYGRTCPTIPDVSVFGQTLHFDTSVFCQWLVLGGQIVLVMASLLSLKIISSSGSES